MIYLMVFIGSFILTYLMKNYAIKKSLVARINERSSHSVPTPHGGGIAIAFTWFFGLSYLFATSQIDDRLFYSLLCGCIISIISFFDDIYELSPKIRLLTQALVAFCGITTLGGLNNLDMLMVSIENQWITNLFSFLLVVWYINLYNFLDGINGYAGSEALFLSAAGILLFGGTHFLVLGASVLGFLLWNYNRAKIFMGDVGSTLLGYNIAIFTLYYANMQPSDLWIWIVLFGLFWFDATVTLFRRKFNGEKLSHAHKKHAYQRLTQAGWSHSKVTNYAMVLNIILLGIVYCIQDTLVMVCISIALLGAVMKFIDIRKRFE